MRPARETGKTWTRHGVEDDGQIQHTGVICGGGGTAITCGFLSIIYVGNVFRKARHLVANAEGEGVFRTAPPMCRAFGPMDGCAMRAPYTTDGAINSAEGVRSDGRDGRAPHDLREGWISVECARDVYSVITVGSVANDNPTLDLAAIQTQRASMRSAG